MKVKFFEDFLKLETSIKEKDFTEVSTDTRSVKKGALFVSLKGPNFNANEFAAEAIQKGALAAVVDDAKFENRNENIYLVSDAKAFLKSFAKAWVDRLDPTVIGITGSNGKTTTKVFTAQILQDFFPLHFSPKSFNNDIGVPLTQLGLRKSHKILVCEIGTSGPGEIEDLTKQSPADVSMVTTVGPSHLDKLKNLEGVYNEKKQIYLHSKFKKAIFNLDNSYTKQMYKECSQDFQSVFTLSSVDEMADVYIKVEKESLRGLELSGKIKNQTFKTSVPVFGAYNVYNIMFAMATGLSLGVSVKDLLGKLQNLKTPWGRSQVLKGEGGKTFVFDGYNSNLQSMTSLLDSLRDEPVDKLHLILGEMLELGEESSKHHRQLGKLAGDLNPKSIVFLGEQGGSFREGADESKFSKNLIISNTYNKELALKVKSMLDQEDIVVLKASRGTKIEQFLVDFGVEFEAL